VVRIGVGGGVSRSGGRVELGSAAEPCPDIFSKAFIKSADPKSADPKSEDLKSEDPQSGDPAHSLEIYWFVTLL
jgi:hypothetical protein